MPGAESHRLRARLAELQQTLQRTRSEDVREAVQQAIAECERRLAALEGAGETDLPQPVRA